MSTYILVWREKPGGLIHTYADDEGNPKLFGGTTFEISPVSEVLPNDIEHKKLFELFDTNLDTSYAVSPELARAALGWEL